MKVIGVIGKNGSGKDEVLKCFRDKYGVPFVATGDIVREIAAKERLKPTRENLQSISDRYFKKYGEGCFVKMAIDKIRENGWNIAGISGVRSPKDVAILRSELGNRFILFNVYVSDPHMRFERMRKRGEGRDAKTYEEFLRQDEGEEKLFNIEKAAAEADYSVSNDGTLGQLRQTIDNLVNDDRVLQ